ncbi:MAG TPA: hypothetical protein VK524_07195 [Polyangiaceae bacterium]|nr:hypothetical protein [Polyangiaceae bacterium]
MDGLSSLNGLTGMNGLTGVNGLTSMNGLTSANGLTTMNGLTTISGLVSINGLTSTNGLRTLNGLPSMNGGMSMNGLVSMNGLLTVSGTNYQIIPNGGDMMNSANGRMLVSYMIRCALSPTQSITRKDSAGTSYTYTGQIGLAPEWYSSSVAACGQACEEKISACLMAHYKPAGVGQQIFIGGAGLGDNTSCATDSCSGSSYYNEKEGAFWGNLFIQNQPQAYYCQSDYNSLSDTRSCADDTDSSTCPFTPSQDECEDLVSSSVQGYTYTDAVTKIDRPTQDSDEKYAFTKAHSSRIGMSGSEKAGNGWTQLPKKCAATVQQNVQICTASHTETKSYAYNATTCDGSRCTSTGGCTKTCTICDTYGTGTKITDGTKQCWSKWAYPITTWFHH